MHASGRLLQHATFKINLRIGAYLHSLQEAVICVARRPFNMINLVGVFKILLTNDYSGLIESKVFLTYVKTMFEKACGA